MPGDAIIDLIRIERGVVAGDRLAATAAEPFASVGK
jgi:hypothetical protein